MTNKELKEYLNTANDNDNILLVAEDNIYNIISVNSTNNSILMLIAPLIEDKNNIKIATTGGDSGNNLGFNDALDVFGDLNSTGVN